MSWNADAHFEHQLTAEELATLPEILNRRCRDGVELAGLPALRERHRSETPMLTRWRWSAFGDGAANEKELAAAVASPRDFTEPLHLRGPAGLWLTVGPRAGNVGLCRWMFFLADADYERDARRAARAIVAALGGSDLLYVNGGSAAAERGVYDSLEGTRASLAATVGPPAPDAAAVLRLIDEMEDRWRAEVPLDLDDSEWRRRCDEIEREVRARYPYGDYFLEPEA